MAKREPTADTMVRVQRHTVLKIEKLREMMKDHDKANGRPNTDYSRDNLIDFAIRRLLGEMAGTKEVRK